jgi:hypothetical protein
MHTQYRGRPVALLTQHGKERVIAPVLEPGLGCTIEHVTGFDTDLLGTFTRETPRPGTQLEAARRKARKGMELAGTSLGVASEGSFGPDPFTGLFSWNVELLVWVDDELGVEVVGVAQSAARTEHIQSDDWEAVAAFAEREGFPQHNLVLRNDGPDGLALYKGIADWAQLKTHFDLARAQSAGGTVFVERDLRAFANPSRMQLIAQAASDLLARLQSQCPACEAPGYWIAARNPGLPCAACGQSTTSFCEEVWSCPRCQHKEVRARTDVVAAEPKDCPHCNP